MRALLGLFFVLGLCPSNAVLQCPSVITSRVISSLLTAFRGLVAISAPIDELCQGNIYQSPPLLYSKLFNWPCMLRVLGIGAYTPKFNSVIFSAQSIFCTKHSLDQEVIVV